MHNYQEISALSSILIGQRPFNYDFFKEYLKIEYDISIIDPEKIVIIGD